jgi:hypothetical protein
MKTTKGSSTLQGPPKPTNSTLKKSTKLMSSTAASNQTTTRRPASAKPTTSTLGIGSTAKQLSEVATSKDVDSGIHMTQILTYYR